MNSAQVIPLRFGEEHLEWLAYGHIQYDTRLGLHGEGRIWTSN